MGRVTDALDAGASWLVEMASDAAGAASNAATGAVATPGGDK